MKLLVISNMYPSEAFPSYGIFVKNFCGCLDELGISYEKAVMQKSAGKAGKIYRYIAFYVKTFVKCMTKKYDYIYIHYASYSSPSVLAANKFRKLHIITNVHGSDVVPENGRQKKMQAYTEKILRVSEKVVVPSEYFKTYVQKKYGLSSQKVEICFSGGVNMSVFYVQPSEWKSCGRAVAPCEQRAGQEDLSCPITGEETHDGKKEKLVLGYVGRVSYGKGWDVLMEACAQLDIPYQLIFVGSGPENDKLTRLIQSKGLEKQIARYGLLPQTELADIYRQLDVFIFPTEREGESLGLVALEAMACGAPVIASDYAAPKDYVIDGVNGFKFPKSSVEGLRDAIQKFAALSPADRQKLRAGAVRTAEAYRQERVKEQVRQILTGE